MVTKSGTNQLHGSLFETFRNNAAGLRARRRDDGNTASPYKRNEFGASAGGPVRLPKLYNGQDKTFWFFSYEGMRLRQNKNVSDVVPTEAMWNGDFSGLIDANNNVVHIYDPWSTTAAGTRTPFAGDKIPNSAPYITPESSKLFDYLKTHTPAATSGASPILGVNYRSSSADPSGTNSYTGKIDHHITDKDYLAGRFTLSRGYNYSYFGSGPISPDNSYNTLAELQHVYNASISYTHTFSATIVNEFLFSGQRSVQNRGGGREDVKWDPLLGLSNPLSEYGWPTITANQDFGAFVWDSENKQPEHLAKLIPEDNLTVIRGKHQFKTGFRYANNRENTRSAPQGQGRYKFENDFTSLWDPASQQIVPYSGFGLAAMMLGQGTYYRVNYNRPYFYLRQSETGLYAQDSYRVNSRLTLNYGFRWDYFTPYFESSNRMFTLDTSQIATTNQLISPAGHPADSLGIPPSLLQSYANGGLVFTTADKAGFPARLFNSDKHDFGPRAGFAYRLKDKTVLRGGYGVYYFTVPNAQMLLAQQGSAPLSLQYTTSPSSWNGINNYDVFNGPIPGERIGDPNMVDINSPQSTSAPFAFTPFSTNMKNARVHSWNFTIEREIAPMTSLRISYIGNHGGNLMQSVSLNEQESQYLYVTRTGQQLPASYNALRANPFWGDPYSEGGIVERDPIGYSNLNSLQVNLERRYRNGLQFQTYYVFSRDLSTSDASEGFSSNPGFIVTDSVRLANGAGMSLADRQRLLYANVASVPKHQVNWNLIYDLPFGSGKWLGRNAHGFLNQVIGNWQIASMGYRSSGSWLTPTSDPTNPWGANLQMLADPRLSGSQQQVVTYNGSPYLLFFKGFVNGSQIGLPSYQPALVSAGPAQDGLVPVTLKDGSTINVRYDVYNSMPKNFIQGPAQWSTDCSLFKNFQFSETKRLRFTADAFNLFNHPNNIDPDLKTGLIDLGTQRNEPRIIQFSLRLDF